MKKAATIYTCDICQAERQASGTTPAGWIEWSRDDPNLDRSFIEHAICLDCVGYIRGALSQAGRAVGS